MHILVVNYAKSNKQFRTFSLSVAVVSQDFIGNVDVKTNSVHFYAQRYSSFTTPNAVVPFQLVRLNVGNAFDEVSGTFISPVPGIYQFHLSALKDMYSSSLDIFLQVNDVNVGVAYTSKSSALLATSSYEVVSLSASLRLAAGDRVNLYQHGSGVLYDNSNHHTHFSGSLVEEDFI